MIKETFLQVILLIQFKLVPLELLILTAKSTHRAQTCARPLSVIVLCTVSRFIQLLGVLDSHH